MSNNNVLVTGPPRSGTTLTCYLLNKLPETVALHEPMSVRKFAELEGYEEICRMVQRFCDEQRESIHTRKRAKSKNVAGAVPDNPFGADRSKTGLRRSIISRGEIVVDKQLSQAFMLVVKHPAAFTAVLEGLVKCFPVYAVIRNPLATLASWNSIPVNVWSGHAPAAERLAPDLKAQLAAIDDTLDRQIHLLGWFHEQFHRYLPERSIIRYESVIESGGRALSVVRPEAANLNEPLEIRNKSELYDYQNMLRMGERLLNSEGAYWESYTRESVEDLLNELEPVVKKGRSPLVSRFDKALRVARDVKARLSSVTRGAALGVEQDKEQAEDPEGKARRRLSEQKEEIRSKKQELRRITTRLRAAKERGEVSERIEQTKRAKRKKQEIFQLEMELRAAEERAEDRPAPHAGSGTGALPDFAIIGPTKSGTTFLYHLLTQHPLVEPAAFKEPHYFNMFFDEEGTEWYRRCFPAPRWKDGQKTITGEATPEYLVHPRVPERMAEVVPEARLIALLRNPVERAYSAYHHRVRNGQETRTFEEAVEQALEAQERRPLGEGGETPGRGDGASDSRHKHLSNSIYVEHLQRWSEYFPREQMLVLKSEDLFDNPGQTLKVVLEFLGLPEWEPDASELGDKLNRGGYERGMDPAVRRRLEAFFEPHNRRLYEYLGKDLGW